MALCWHASLSTAHNFATTQNGLLLSSVYGSVFVPVFVSFCSGSALYSPSPSKFLYFELCLPVAVPGKFTSEGQRWYIKLIHQSAAGHNPSQRFVTSFKYKRVLKNNFKVCGSCIHFFWLPFVPSVAVLQKLWRVPSPPLERQEPWNGQGCSMQCRKVQMHRHLIWEPEPELEISAQDLHWNSDEKAQDLWNYEVL